MVAGVRRSNLAVCLTFAEMYLHILMGKAQGKSPPYGGREGQVLLNKETLQTEGDVTDSLLHIQRRREDVRRHRRQQRLDGVRLVVETETHWRPLYKTKGQCMSNKVRETNREKVKVSRERK